LNAIFSWCSGDGDREPEGRFGGLGMEFNFAFCEWAEVLRCAQDDPLFCLLGVDGNEFRKMS
jgi:hypothetical protein